MDKHYADTVRLLLDIAPEVFVNDIFGFSLGLCGYQSSGLDGFHGAAAVGAGRQV